MYENTCVKLREFNILYYTEFLYNYDNFNMMFIVTRKILNSKSSKKRGGQIKTTLVELSQHQKDAIIGTSLGDFSMERVKSTHNTRLRFDQNFPYHAPYLTHLYVLFKNLVGAVPKVHVRKPDKRTGKSYASIAFKTLRYPCFNYYYDLFYINGVKGVPFNI